MKTLQKLIDYPPVWLAAFLAIAWWQAKNFRLGLSLNGAWEPLVGGLLVGAGLLLMFLAVIEFRRHQTTFVPRSTPTSFIQSGIYKRSRNPIYLGDVLVLTGMILYWDAVLSLVLIPIFIWIIEKRFIEGEEKTLRRMYHAQFAAYERRVRRWF